MPDEMQKIIEERMAALPDYIREAVSKIDWAPKILDIGKRFDLHVDQMGALQLETLLVLIGLTHPNEYKDNLKKGLNLPEEKVSGIVDSVNTEIFGGIKQMLIDYLAKEDVAPPAPSTAQVSTQNPDPKISKVSIVPNSTPILERDLINSSPTISMSSNEKSVLEKSGILLEDQNSISSKAGGIIEDNKQMISELENPPKTKAVDFSSPLVNTMKTEPLKMPVEKTNYADASHIDSIPKITGSSKSPDPYREPI